MCQSIQQIRELGGAPLFVGSASQNADGFVEDESKYTRSAALPWRASGGPDRWHASDYARPPGQQGRWYQSRHAEGVSL